VTDTLPVGMVVPARDHRAPGLDARSSC